MATDVNIQLGYKDSAWFTANPTLVLLAGQIVYLDDQSGTYKLGDGITALSALSFLGGGSGVQSVSGTNVDNTDPLNPVVLEQTQLVSSDGNTTITAADGEAETFVTDGVDSIAISVTPTTFTKNGVEIATVNDIPSLSGYEQNTNKTATVAGNESDTTKYLNVKGYYDYLIGFVWLTAARFGTWLTGLTSKTTPVDADEIVLSDSAATNAAKKVSLTNFKAFLKTYFDTLYITQNAWTNEFANCTLTGWSSYTTSEVYVKDLGDSYAISGFIFGTSNSTSTVIVLPFSVGANVGDLVYGLNNGTGVTCRMNLPANNTITFYSSAAGGTWTSSGTKAVSFDIIVKK